MKQKFLLIGLAILTGILMTGCFDSDDDEDVTEKGTISGTLTFVDALSAAVVGDVDYYVTVMTATQYAAWDATDDDPTEYETAHALGNFTSSGSTNTDDYTITNVPVGTYYVLVFAWVNSDMDSDEAPDYAGYGHILTGPGIVTASGTLDVDLTVSPMPSK